MKTAAPPRRFLPNWRANMKQVTYRPLTRLPTQASNRKHCWDLYILRVCLLFITVYTAGVPTLWYANHPPNIFRQCIPYLIAASATRKTRLHVSVRLSLRWSFTLNTFASVYLHTVDTSHTIWRVANFYSFLFGLCGFAIAVSRNNMQLLLLVIIQYLCVDCTRSFIHQVTACSNHTK